MDILLNLIWPLLPALLLQGEDTGWLQLEIPELHPGFGLVAILVLVLLNGFFVATEFALVAVRRSRIEQLASEGNVRAAVVKQALAHLDTYIAATQLGITMASLALGWIGEPALAHFVDPFLEVVLPAEWAVAGSHAISVTVSFAVITALHIVLGELAPKGIALQRPEATALLVGIPAGLFLRLFRPFIVLLNGVGNLVLKLFGFRSVQGEEAVHSVEELRYLVHTSREAGVLESAEEEIASRAFNFGELTARSLVVPRTEIAGAPADTTFRGLLDLVGRTRHTRFPVYRESIDNILGVVHLTDALDWVRTNPEDRWDVQKSLRPVLMVPEAIKADRLLAQMRAERTHLAVVVDEYGGVEGIVTLQDLLERIVGEMPDLDDTEPDRLQVLPDGTARVDGLMSLSELKQRFDLALGDGEAETIGGYVMETLGRVPELGEELDLENYRLRVSAMDGQRVAEVTVLKR